MLFDGNSKFCTIFHHFQVIHLYNVHDLDIDNWSMSNLNMPIEWPYMISIFIFHPFQDIFIQNMHDIHLDL